MGWPCRLLAFTRRCKGAASCRSDADVRSLPFGVAGRSMACLRYPWAFYPCICSAACCLLKNELSLSQSFSSIMGTASHVHDGQVRYFEVMPQYPPNDGSLGWCPSLPGRFVWALSDSFCETGCVPGTCCYSITYMAIIAIPPRMRRGMRRGLPHICALCNRCAVVLTEGGRGQTDRRMSAIV